MKKTFRGITAGLLSAALLSACGGGGGGGNGGGSVGSTLPPLAIDANNAMQVTAAVLDASGMVVDVGTPGGPVTGVAVEGNGARMDLAQVISAQLDLFSVARDQVALGQVAGVVIPATKENCSVNGTVTLSGNLASTTTLTKDDTLNATFKNCDDGDGVVLNGKMDIVVVSFVGTIDLNATDIFVPPFDFTFDTTLTNLSVTDTVSGSTFTSNGELTLREATSDGVVFDSKFSGSSLTMTMSATSDILENFLILANLHEDTGVYSTNGGGDDGSGNRVCCAALSSTALGGTVNFDTTLPFAGVRPSFPDIGDMNITGATVVVGNLPSRVAVHAMDSQCVCLYVDPDGAGVNDIILTSWESLPSGIQDSSSCSSACPSSPP